MKDLYPRCGSPIENIHVIFDKRIPHGTTFSRATCDCYSWMFSIILLYVIESITVALQPYPTLCVTVTQWLPLSFFWQNNWLILLPLTLLKHCCTRCKNSNKFGFNSLAGVFGKRTPHGTNNCSTANPSAYGTSPKTAEEYAVGLPTEGREVLRATIYSKNLCR